MKFRKKPVEIEAMLVPGEDDHEAWGKLCGWLVPGGPWQAVRLKSGELCIEIATLEGNMLARPGDWIIRGVQRELYPCKPDIFAATYEAAD